MNTPPTTQVPPPSIPREWPFLPEPPKSSQVLRCPKCGLDISLNKPMSYTCVQYNCPTGMGPAIS